MLNPELQTVLDQAKHRLQLMANYRRPFDAKRLSWYRQFLQQRDALKFPDNRTNRSNTSVPYALSNVETVKARVTDAFFSFQPWFECKGRGSADAEAADKMQLVEGYKLHRAKIIQNIQTLLDNILIYGTGAIKVDWDWGYDVVTYPEPVYAQQPVQGPDGQPQMDENGQPVTQPVMDSQGQPVIQGYRPQTKQIPKACPKFYPLDIYDFYVDPDNTMVACMTERTLGELLREAQERPNFYFPEGLEEIQSILSTQENPMDIVIRIAELWDRATNTVTILTFDNVDGIQWKDARASFRNSGYTPYRRKVYTGPAILLWHGPNQFMHKRIPVLYTNYMKLPNEAFGIGVIESIADLSNALDNFVNMVTDNWNLGINRRYAYNTEADIDHEALNSFNTPGGKVGVAGDPTKVIMPLPTHTPGPNDYLIIEMYRNMIEMASGVSDFYSKGVGSSGANDTATGISSIINETNYKFRMFIRDFELDILEPILQMVASMIQQFTTDEQEVMITDCPPEIAKYPVVQPEELIGTFDFNLVAANYAVSKVVRQRNLLAFYKIASQSPFWNQYEGLQELAKVFEIRDAQRLLYTPQQVQQIQTMQIEQQARMMLLENAVKTQSAVEIQEARKTGEPPAPWTPESQLPDSAEDVLAWLQEISPPPPIGMPGQTGPQPEQQVEGAIPGVGNNTETREFAQNMGANAIGTAGMGQGGNG